MKLQISLIVLLISVSCCKKPVDPPKGDGDGPKSSELTLKFNTKFKGTIIDWNQFYVTGSNDTVKFNRIKYILSNFTLEKMNGELVTMKDVYAYLSFQTGRDSLIIKAVPHGDYKSIRFKVGLDSAVNHGDPGQYSPSHPLAPGLNDMHWTWSGGYIFNIIEGNYKSNGQNEAFSYHVVTLKNARINSFVENYNISKNTRMVFDVNADKIFNNIVNFSIKNDGATSHSAPVDPIMDKFIQNAPGVLDLVSVK